MNYHTVKSETDEQIYFLRLIAQTEQLQISFVRDPMWISFAASAGITAVISALIHFIAFREIRGLKLSDLTE